MRTLIGFALSIVLAAPAMAQTTRNVPAQYPTIQAAIASCVNGDNVLVAPGTYSGSINFLGRAINVHSSGGALATTITGTSGGRVVSFTSNETPNSILDGFTVTGGGGGIACQNASPVIQNCRITGNFATMNSGSGSQVNGGGIYLYASAGVSSPTISNCVVYGNIAFDGGGLYVEGATTIYPSITNCSFVSNTAIGGGGSYGYGGGAIFKSVGCSALLTGCTFDANASNYDGGAIWCSQTSSISLTSCRITNNVAINYTSGLSASDAGQISMTACLVSGNTAQALNTGLGGVVRVQGTTAATIKACTITKNHSSAIVGGLVIQLNAGSTANVSSSIIWGNDLIDVINIQAVNPNISYSDVGIGAFPVGTGNISADPLFLDPAGGDFHLSSVSPCRNAGTPGITGLPATDLDGGTRIVGAAVDMGSDEVPVITRPGTADGVDLYTKLNGSGDPLAGLRTPTAGTSMNVRIRSATGALVGGLPLFAVRMFTTGFPPMQPPGFPSIWVDGGSIIVYGALTAPPFSFPGLPAAGLEFNFIVPAGLAGMTLRMQGLVSTGTALNGAFATTNATDIQF